MSYGIRVKNPLPNPVRVEVIDGKTIIREAIVAPGQNVFIVLDKPGTFDVRTSILNKDGQGTYDELGPATWQITDHQDVKAPRVKPILLTNTVILSIPKQQKTARYWRDVVIWEVTPGCLGELLAVEKERREKINWRLRIITSGDGRFGGVTISLGGPASFSGKTLTGGQIVKLQAQSLNIFDVPVSGRVSGRETVIYDETPPTKVETTPAEEPEEVHVRSLADMFKDMAKEEVKV